MNSPLFPNFNRRQQEQARQAFRSTELGKLLTSTPGTTSPAKISRFAGALKRYTDSPEKYGKFSTSIKNMLFRELSRNFGPIGQLISTLIRPGGQALASLTRELDAASDLLKAFGYDVTKPTSTLTGSIADVTELLDSDFLPEEVVSSRPGQGRSGRQQPSTAPQPVAPPQPPMPPPRGPGAGSGGFGGINPDDPLFTGEMIPVTSTNVHSIGYEFNRKRPGDGTLKVRFLAPAPKGVHKTRPGSLYHYVNVPPEIFQAFRAAASKGKFVWDRLRIRGTVSGHQYYYWLAAIRDGYVPRQARQIGDAEYFLRRNIQGENGNVYTSQLQDEFVSRIGGGPNRAVPNRGTPNRGAPNRGKQPGLGDHAALN